LSPRLNELPRRKQRGILMEQKHSFLRRKRRGIIPYEIKWVLISMLIVIAGIGFVFSVHPFLAVNQPVPSEILVTEGWLPDYALVEVKREFERGKYKYLLATGLPLERGSFLISYKTYAHLAAATLVQLGVEADRVYAVPGRYVENDRTYASALSLRQWLEANTPSAKSINVASKTVHARRTRLLFQKALGPGISVGVLALPDEEYDPACWWRSSAGVKTVLTEGIGYLYARILQ